MRLVPAGKCVAYCVNAHNLCGIFCVCVCSVWNPVRQFGLAHGQHINNEQTLPKTLNALFHSLNLYVYVYIWYMKV